MMKRAKDQRRATVKISGSKELVEEIIYLLENDFGAIQTSNLLSSPDGVHVYLAIVSDQP